MYRGFIRKELFMQKFAVFASGSGSNLQAIIDAIKAGDINAELTLVFSNRRKAGALKRAQEANIKTLVLEKRNYATPQSYDREIVMYLKEEKIDFIVLAGYMKILTPWFVKQYDKKIINVHPSLLPAFKGANGIKDQFTYAVKVAGVTIHMVNDKMDAGPIIMQKSFKVSEKETLESLEEHIHKIEHEIFPKAVALFADDRLKIGLRKVEILDKK
ncbi:MAG: phosphoribosylglycinamide formyltransferase-1 [Lysobacterales bacterium]|jgi:phosphoribosylglycinamide formyltransferase-1